MQYRLPGTGMMSLITIPPEILLRILRYLLISDATTPVSDANFLALEEERYDLSSQILRTCHYIHDIGIPLLYGQNRLWTATDEFDPVLIAGLPSSAVPHISSLCFDGYPPLDPLQSFSSLKTMEFDLVYHGPGRRTTKTAPTRDAVMESIAAHVSENIKRPGYWTAMATLLPKTIIGFSAVYKSSSPSEFWKWNVGQPAPVHLLC